MIPRTLRTLMVFVLLVSIGGTCGAKPKKKQGVDKGAKLTILEISPMSVTVDAGKDVQESYDITGTTKATLNGLAVQPSDLRAGMVASVVLSSDNKSVVSIAAKDAPRTTKKPVVHHDNVWVNMN
jgi:hypothetical protein